LKIKLKEKLQHIIQELNIQLQDECLLTEAASGAYACTPVLGALAGAEVHAFARDSKYGSAGECIKEVQSLAELCGVSDRIHFHTEKNEMPWERATVITNSGALRPLDSAVLERVSASCRIPLMFESWEFRAQDLDLDFCKLKGIRVAGTNERHPQTDVFGYLGDLVVRLIQDAKQTPYRNKFIVVSNNDFTPYLCKPLVSMSAAVGVYCPLEYKSEIENLGATYLGDWNSTEIPNDWKSTSAVIYTASPFSENLWGTFPLLNFNIWKTLSSPLFLRFAGDVREADLVQHEINFHPENVPAGHMGILPSAIGWDPIIRLQAGSLKVAELMKTNEAHYNNFELAQYL
jgi:hypothetical protein